MDFDHRLDGGRPRVRLSFRSVEGERIEMDLLAVREPLARHAGLVDPGGHAATSSLPVMYRDASALAHPDSRVRIDGRAYEIPRSRWIPFFFTGMKGYYSVNFRHGALRAFAPRPVSLESAPRELVPGEQWRYRRGGERITYTIGAVEGDRLVLQGPRERVWLERGRPARAGAGRGSVRRWGCGAVPALLAGDADLWYERR